VTNANVKLKDRDSSEINQRILVNIINENIFRLYGPSVSEALVSNGPWLIKNERSGFF
jgi:hypothetical protein